MDKNLVGVIHLTRRPRIALEVLEGMCQYLMVANGPKRKIREERMKSSMIEVVKDRIAQKTILRLEPTPLISQNLDKGKGKMFGYSDLNVLNKSVVGKDQLQNLTASAFTSSVAFLFQHPVAGLQSTSDGANFRGESGFPQDCPTVYSAGFSEIGTSGTILKISKPRLRPTRSKRTPKPKSKDPMQSEKRVW